MLLFCRGRRRNVQKAGYNARAQPFFCSLNFLFSDVSLPLPSWFRKLPIKHRKRPLLIATEKPMLLFRLKSSQKSSESWKLNGNIFIELFLSDLDEKITSASSKRERNEKQTGSARRADKLFTFLRSFLVLVLTDRRHVELKISLPLDNFSLRSQ